MREVYSQLQGGAGPCDILLNTRLGTLRDRVPATLIDVYHSINNPQRIQKAFELCRSGEFNLSQASLTSPSLRAILDNCHIHPRPSTSGPSDPSGLTPLLPH
ncbi:uncharacterized protein EI90DRAFT_3118411 [Cantharellus anzutake]|uniref:uncharacterized protein n=1 Tax=Cantharellus anzutake TaxID=1750568 RepID=UPI001906A7C6|nr:uncharacterized protein EI90DRAFT_3118411 [Cantharellus anzutake]KAF8337959.1 hypothetical protein EI90DRAFT_3118411 [Cantharellus anzutake]